MDIKRVAKSAINETIVVQIVASDYNGQVKKRLKELAATASIKGFRKGQAPASFIQKQYGNAVKFEEINKTMDLALQRFIQSEKLNLLGSPVPVLNENVNWEGEEFTFEFEIGLVPEFDLDLAKCEVVKYNIKADESLINEQVERIEKQFGNKIATEEVSAESLVTGTFKNETAGIESKTSLELNVFKNEDTKNNFIGKKAGDVVTVNTKGLFADDHLLMDFMKVPHELVHTLEVDVTFEIEKIENIEKAELNQELFDKLFGEGNVTSLEVLKEKIKEDAEKQFAQSAEQKFLSDVTEYLIENTKFDLPSEFLIRWIQSKDENKMSLEAATAEYAKSEKGLRFQLIESKALSQNNVQITFEDLKEFTANLIRQQMAQFGQNPTEEEINDISARIMADQNEVKRLSEQVVAEKLMQLYKEKVNAIEKEVTYNEFIAAQYGE